VACGWAGIKNGELLRRAEAEFDLFITADKNLRYQQNHVSRSIAILVLSTNNLRRIVAAKEPLCIAINSLSAKGFQVLETP
jgi:hypothetical protein